MNENQNTENYSIVFSSSIENLTEVNSSFDRGVMKIAYHGGNRNKMYISKKAFNEAIPSIFNCPVVCNYSRETDSIGAHDVDIVKKDNTIKMVNITTPVGVVPESANTWWSEVTEDNGDVHEYLCTDILIWKRQEAYPHIKENGITDESMEIRIKSGHRKDDGFYHVDSFEFLAFCLLESAPPCFESAGIELFTLADFKTQYANMMEDFKREFSQVMTASADDIEQNLSKGGTDELDINELMQKYGLSAEDVDFDTAGMEQADIEARFAQIKEHKQANPDATFTEKPEEDNSENDAAEASEGDNSAVSDAEPAAEEQNEEPEAHDNDGDDEPARRNNEQNFSLSAEQFFQELYEALGAEVYSDPIWGDIRRYWYMDHDYEANEVYVYDMSDDKIYGFTYTRNGDHVVIDFATKKRKKTVFVDFDEGDTVFSVRAIVSEFRAKFAKRTADEAEVFGKFTDLNGNELFEHLRGNCSDMTIDQIEEKCFAIRGRSTTVANFSMNGSVKAPRIPIENQGAGKADEPYGGVFAKYKIGTR